MTDYIIIVSHHLIRGYSSHTSLIPTRQRPWELVFIEVDRTLTIGIHGKEVPSKTRQQISSHDLLNRVLIVDLTSLHSINGILNQPETHLLREQEASLF